MLDQVFELKVVAFPESEIGIFRSREVDVSMRALLGGIFTGLPLAP